MIGGGAMHLLSFASPASKQEVRMRRQRKWCVQQSLHTLTKVCENTVVLRKFGGKWEGGR